MSSFWQNKRILVTGGAGFIGSFVVDALVQRGVRREDIVIPRSRDCDLRVLESCRKAADGCQIVLHLAAETGGIAFSRSHPATQYYNCSLINLHMMEAARLAGVQKFVFLGNLLAYPAAALSPLQEADLHNGKIAETHLGVGLSKRDLVLLAEMYHRQFGMNVVGVLAANAYGPRDRFDPAHSHVIPATIAKCFQRRELVVWGDGTPTRDFLYVEDLADGLLLAAERLEAPQFVNLASGTEISIRELVSLIARLTAFSGRIVFDISKGGGDPRRVASVSKAQQLIGFKPRYSFEEGLQRTIEWYKAEVLEKSEP
jgi:GDP-L-fucose synthase